MSNRDNQTARNRHLSNLLDDGHDWLNSEAVKVADREQQERIARWRSGELTSDLKVE